MDVIVLAGGRCSPELRQATGVDSRAEIVVAGRTLVDRVIEAVGGVGEPILVGGPADTTIRQVPSGDNFCESLENGLRASESDYVLVCTVDLPCLTKNALKDFIARCDSAAGLSFPIVPMAACEKTFPGMSRTTLKLREGRFTGGNVALVDREAMLKSLPIIEAAYQRRKKPLALAGMVGYGTLIRVVIGQLIPWTLPLSALESVVGRFLGLKVKGIKSDFAELGADLDRPEHLAAFESLMKSD